MPKSRSRRSSPAKAGRRAAGSGKSRAKASRSSGRKERVPSTATLRRLVRPIVRELLAEELDRLEDRLDAQDAREALAEPGGITHEELLKKLGR